MITPSGRTYLARGSVCLAMEACGDPGQASADARVRAIGSHLSEHIYHPVMESTGMPTSDDHFLHFITLNIAALGQLEHKMKSIKLLRPTGMPARTHGLDLLGAVLRHVKNPALGGCMILRWRSLSEFSMGKPGKQGRRRERQGTLIKTFACLLFQLTASSTTTEPPGTDLSVFSL
jgi:hypothetical protein